MAFTCHHHHCRHRSNDCSNHRQNDNHRHTWKELHKTRLSFFFVRVFREKFSGRVTLIRLETQKSFCELSASYLASLVLEKCNVLVLQCLSICNLSPITPSHHRTIAQMNNKIEWHIWEDYMRWESVCCLDDPMSSKDWEISERAFVFAL